MQYLTTNRVVFRALHVPHQMTLHHPLMIWNRSRFSCASSEAAQNISLTETLNSRLCSSLIRLVSAHAYGFIFIFIFLFFKLFLYLYCRCTLCWKTEWRTSICQGTCSPTRWLSTRICREWSPNDWPKSTSEWRQHSLALQLARQFLERLPHKRPF